MNSRNHERLLPDDAPSSQQLHKLASIGAGSAAQRSRLKTMQRTERAHFFIEEIDLYNEALPVEDFGRIRHRMAGRIGVKALETTGVKIWSLKYFDTYWVEQETGSWTAGRTLYRFEWTRTKTLMAERSLKVISDHAETVEKDMADEVDNFTLDNDTPDVWHAQAQFEAVTRNDCLQLIDDSTEYFSLVDDLQRRAA